MKLRNKQCCFVFSSVSGVLLNIFYLFYDKVVGCDSRKMLVFSVSLLATDRTIGTIKRSVINTVSQCKTKTCKQLCYCFI